MRLPRPYIPLRVRVQVAERQLLERGIDYSDDEVFGLWLKRYPARVGTSDEGFALESIGDGKLLPILLEALFGDTKVELHHRPALVNRERSIKAEGFCYVPDANDPAYLTYLPADEHGIETRVRGLHGQHSDLALARKRKRKERKAKAPKRKWPSRPFPKRRKKW